WESASTHFEALRTAPDGTVLELECRMKHKDGQWRWFICRELIFMRAADGWPQQILGVAQDITERRQGEEMLREQEKVIQSLKDAVHVATYIFDVNVISAVFNNSQLVTLLGYSSVEIDAMQPEIMSLLIHPEDQRLVNEHLDKLKNAPDGSVLEIESRVKHR